MEDLDPEELDRLRNPFKPAGPVPPPKKGWVRGAVRNFVQETELTPYGYGMIWRFEIIPEFGAPPVRVEMHGLDLSSWPFEGQIVDVYCGDYPSDPVMADRLGLPHWGGEIQVYNAPRTRRASGSGRNPIWARFLPAAAVALLVLAALWSFVFAG